MEKSRSKPKEFLSDHLHRQPLLTAFVVDSNPEQGQDDKSGGLLFKELLRKVLFVRSGFFKKKIAYARASQDFPTGSVLVIAPHPDDEVFACGGLIEYKIRHQERVDVLFMTNGEASHHGCCPGSKDQVASERNKLAKQALGAIGGHGLQMHWLNLPDGGIASPAMRGFDEQTIVLRNVIENIKPDQILVPHEFDSHCDHVNSNKIAMAAINGLAIEVFFYPVWMLYRFQRKFFFRRVKGRILKLDISQFHSKKLQAISIYENALKSDCPNKTQYIGKLPESLMCEFKRKYEIYIRPV